MIKRILSVALTICVLLSCVIAGDYTSVKTEAAATDIDYGLVDNVQYGQILHCWNWSFDNIRKNMQRIAEQGFTAVQTSPIQSSKESTRESWSSVNSQAWVYYQPISFNIEQNSWNALGTKSQFEAMCDEAHKYGIKVIVDTVFNHMANDYTENSINGQITSDLRSDSSCWYSVDWNCSNWEDRYDVTHHCLSGFPDLNTSSSKVQSYAKSFLKECIDAGADGFRFDAAKHIETPKDASGTASDFWPNVLGSATSHAQSTRGITPYYYGEILGSPGGGLSISAYTDYMSVTDSSTGNDIRNAIASGNASGACRSGIANGAAPLKTVQWNESHDTYYADNDSIWISNDNMKKTWAIVGTRAQVCGLYLARPKNNDTTMLGDGDITAWADKEVKAINRFKNYFAGHGEYLASSGNIVYNERGNTGVVLVNVSGGSTSVSVPAHKMYDGVYTDAITGNHFSVSNGTISGEIGSSGIAVVYSYPSKVYADKSSQAFRGDTIDVTLTYDEATGGKYTIGDDYVKQYTYGDVISIGCGVEYGESVDLVATASGGTTTDSISRTYKKLHPDTQLKMFFDNSSKNWDQVYAYVYNSDGDKNKSWPGELMTYDESLSMYVYDVPQGFETSKVVFTDGNGNQTPSSGGHSFNGYTCRYKDGNFYGYNTGVEGKLYFKPCTNWLSDNARFAVYVWNSSSNAWVDFKDSDGDGIFEATLPSGVWKECIFARMNPSTTSNNWDNIWNQTGDMGISNNHNYFMIANGWDTSDGAWSIIDNSVVGTTCNAQLVGTFNNWDKTANPFVYTDYKTAVTSIDLPEGTYTFKLLKNDAWFGNPGVINDATSGSGWRMCKNDKDNCTINASGGTYTFTLDTEELRISVAYEPKEVETQLQTDATSADTTEIPTVLETQYTPKAGYYLVGVLDDVECWSRSTFTQDRMFVTNPHNDGEYMLDYTFVKGDEIKVVYYDGTEITRWYNSSGDNYSIGSSKAGDTTVYFRPNGNDDWSYYYFTVIPKVVEETQAPTDTPTEEPTEKPTEAPTNPPTEEPTEEPTQAPTQALTEEATEATIASGYYLVGTLGGKEYWSSKTLSQDRLFVVNPYNQGEYMLDYTFTKGDEVKVVKYEDGEITRWYNSSGDNYSIGSSKAGDSTVYFRPEGNNNWSYFYFTILQRTVEETETPTEEPTSEPTQEPTPAPTEAPTSAPTQAPTEAPTVAKPVKVENITYAETANTLSVSWDAADGCYKYWIYRYNEQTDVWSIVASTYETTGVVKNLSPNTSYKLKVIGKFSADASYMSLDKADVLEATTAPPASPGSMSITTGLNEAEISWDAVDGATKYWIYKASNLDGPYYIAGSTTDTTAVMGNLHNDMTYYFRIASLTYQNGVPFISDYNDSPYVSITTPKSVDITTALDLNTATTATISWKGLEGADKYWVMYSTTTTDTTASGWATAGTTTSATSLNIKKLTPNTVYHITVRARYTDAAGATKTYDYIPVSMRTAYSDDSFITFTQEGNYIRLTWPEDITDVTKTWVYAYDANGKQLAMSASTTNTAIIKKFDGFDSCYYELYTLSVDGVYSYLTPSGGEYYHE